MRLSSPTPAIGTWYEMCRIESVGYEILCRITLPSVQVDVFFFPFPTNGVLLISTLVCPIIVHIIPISLSLSSQRELCGSLVLAPYYFSNCFLHKKVQNSSSII